MSKNRWPELLSLYSAPDGLPTRKVGPWTEDKLFFWHRYIEITTGAMVGHQQWSAGVAYVDLFGGPGICESEETGKRIPGSALIAAHARKPFSKIFVSEMNPTFARALETRLRATPASQNAQVFTGDCNVCVKEIVQHIPRRALTLAFIDPENLNVDFSTVEKLAKCGQVDLLILFADGMDLVRNVDLYERQPESVLDRMMGPHSNWRELWANLSNRSAENICRLFVDEYQRQLESRLGYVAFREKVMRARNNAAIYRLIFASKNPKGTEFWDKVTKKDRGGQQDLF